jgi:hypothetical protein
VVFFNDPTAWLSELLKSREDVVTSIRLLGMLVESPS